jgi:nitrate reductase beta subunit
MGQHEQLFCSLDTEGGPGMGGAGPHGIQSYQPGSPTGDQSFLAGDGRTRFNLLGWNGQGSAPGLFPDRGSS